MRVALISRSTLYTNPGGDTTQVEGTAKYLRQMGVDADIRLANGAICYQDYDLLHLFNLTRPADHLKHMASGVPYVLSPIYVNYSGYERMSRQGLAGVASKLLPASTIEYSKAVARMLNGSDVITSRNYLWLGHSSSVKRLLSNASCLLPNSENEYRRIVKDFSVNKRYRVIPNGIDADIFQGGAQSKDPLMIVCAARIEGIKNQLNLIRALNNSPFNLYLAGDASANHGRYLAECRRIAGSNIIFLGRQSPNELAGLYARAAIHVLPSWFETTGLSSLEAAAMGCKIVVANTGDVRDYFGDHAFYCEPNDPLSIRSAIEKASVAMPSTELQQKILSHFTWQQAALRTLQSYQEVLRYANRNHRNQGNTQQVRWL